MKPIKIESEEMKRAICSGETYFQVENRKFILLEVDDVKEPYGYEVTDPDEEKQLLRALHSNNPVLDEEEISRLLDEKE
jgi:chorismate mutase